MTSNSNTPLQSITLHFNYEPPGVEPEGAGTHGVLEKCMCGCGSQSGAGSGSGVPPARVETERD